MSTTKEINKLFALEFMSRLYLTLYQQIDKNQYLDSVGIPHQVLDRLSRLSLPVLFHLIDQANEFMSVNIDASKLEKKIDYLLVRQVEQEQESALIRAGAPYPLMKLIFGYTDQHYQFMRKVLGVYSNGRPPHPSERLTVAIYESWKKYRKLSLPARFLAVYEETGASLRSVWVALKEWETEISGVHA